MFNFSKLVSVLALLLLLQGCVSVPKVRDGIYARCIAEPQFRLLLDQRASYQMRKLGKQHPHMVCGNPGAGADCFTAERAVILCRSWAESEQANASLEATTAFYVESKKKADALQPFENALAQLGENIDTKNTAGRRSIETGEGSSAADNSTNNSNCQTSDSPAPKPGYKKSYVNKSNNQRFTIEILGNTRRHRSYCYLGKKYYTVYVEGMFDYGVEYMPKAKLIYSTSIHDKTFGCDGEIASIEQVVFLGTPESYQERATTPGRFLGYEWPGTGFQLRDGVGDIDGHRRAIFDFLCK